MNAESSDWKRFIPYSDELSSLYDELDSCADFPTVENETDVLPPIASMHYDVFGTANQERPKTHLEKQLEYHWMLYLKYRSLIHRYDEAASSTHQMLDSVGSSITTLDTVGKQYEEVFQFSKFSTCRLVLLLPLFMMNARNI